MTSAHVLIPCFADTRRVSEPARRYGNGAQCVLPQTGNRTRFLLGSASERRRDEIEHHATRPSEPPSLKSCPMTRDTNTAHPRPEPADAVAQTRCWIERVVLAHNLCPFARSPFEADRIRYMVSDARGAEDLLGDLREAVLHLHNSPAADTETTLLIHPGALLDFLDYNDFLDLADALIEDLGLSDEYQIASFHPDYQFAGTRPQDAENYTNRSPHPMLHLLRQSSLSAVLDRYPDPEAIPERNIEILRALGGERLRSTLAGCRLPADKEADG